MSVDHETRNAIPAQSREPVPATDAMPVRWQRRPSGRLILGCLILVAVGFIGGVLEAKHTGTTSTSAGSGASALGARTGSATAPGGTPGTATSGSATVGTVKLVDGSTIYLTTPDGSVVKVSTNGATKLSVSATGKASDLKAGATVVVTGTTDASGNIKATAVTQSRTATTGSTAASSQAPAGTGPGARPSAAAG